MSEYYRVAACRETLEKYTKCLAEKTVTRYFGACNELKAAHDKCCKIEYEKRRKSNYEQSKRKIDSKYSVENKTL